MLVKITVSWNVLMLLQIFNQLFLPTRNILFIICFRRDSFLNYSMHLRRIFRWCFTQVGLVFHLDVLCIICVNLIYFHKTFQSNYDFYYMQIWNVWILGKMANLNPKIKIYLLAWHFHRLDWNKLAKDVRICALKNSVEPFMSKSIFSWMNAQNQPDQILILPTLDSFPQLQVK